MLTLVSFRLVFPMPCKLVSIVCPYGLEPLDPWGSFLAASLDDASQAYKLSSGGGKVRL